MPAVTKEKDLVGACSVIVKGKTSRSEVSLAALVDREWCDQGDRRQMAEDCTWDTATNWTLHLTTQWVPSAAAGNPGFVSPY